VVGGEALVAQQRVVVGDRRLAAARARQRVGEQREAGGAREPGDHVRARPVALVAPGDHHAAPGAGEDGAQRLALGAGVRRRRRPAQPRAPAGTAAAARLVVGQRRLEHERLAQRHVEVHGARPVAEGGPDRAAGQGAHPAQPLWTGRVGPHVEEPLRRSAVQAELVDRLTRPDLAQLGWTVRGEHDQRHAGLVGLDHGRQVVGRRRAARAGQHGRAPRRLGQAEREEAADALVDVRPAAQPGVSHE
jgi:hypothetical protein